MTGPPVGCLRLFLAGDVMTGRGIDQILPHPGDPTLYENFVASAEGYVALAENRVGPIRRPVPPAYIWGDLADDLAQANCDARIVNLETTITTANEPEPKGINYRMSPANMPALVAGEIDASGLANNHVLDWGPKGLFDTLAALDAARIAHAGAGRDLPAA
ncbi:MAG: CapA family protein, partial [Paracoccaceae bacterium]